MLLFVPAFPQSLRLPRFRLSSVRCRVRPRFLRLRVGSFDFFGGDVRGFGGFLGGFGLLPRRLPRPPAPPVARRIRASGRRIFQRLEIGGHRQLNLLDHLLADARNFRQLLGSHVGELLDGGDAVASISLDRFRPDALQFGKRRARSGQRGHLRLDLLALFFLALDVHVPADQLAGQAHVLALLADGQRKLRIFDDDFQVARFGIDDLDARDLGRAKATSART